MHSDGSVLLCFLKLEVFKDFDIADLPFYENFGLCCNNFARSSLEPAIFFSKSILT